MLHRSLLLQLIVLMCGLLPSVHAQAQRDPDAARAMLYLALGGGGETALDSDVADLGSSDNDATVGLGARLEVPLLAYLSVGGLIDMLSYKIDGGDRHLSGHFDAWVKGRYVLDVNASLDLELYVGLPVGFSVIGQDRNRTLEREERSLGWNIGTMVGSQALFTERFGAMLELGWRRVQAYNTFRLGDTDLVTRSNQFALNLGGVLLF